MSTNHEDKSLPVLCRSKKIEIGETAITVRELTWHAMLSLLKQMTAESNRLIKDGKVEFKLEQLGEIVATTETLAEFIIIESTGKDEMWVRTLPFADALLVLDAALEVNLSGEVISRAKKVGGRLKETLGIKATVKISPTPSSPPT